MVDHKIDSALDALCDEQMRADWDIYHQIGDVMRSDDMAINLSAEFAARMAARLDAEPAIVAPIARNDLANASSTHGTVGLLDAAGSRS